MKRPWFRFFPADWLADPHVRAMSLAERGMYFELLCHQWRDGSISSDETFLERMIGALIPPIVLDRFPKKGKRRFNKRLKSETIEAQAFSASKRKAGQLGADTRWQSHSSAIGLPMAKHSQSQSQSQRSPIVPLSGDIALESDGPDLGKPRNKRQRVLVDRWRTVALEILKALNAGRKRAIPSSRDIRPTYTALFGIASQLESGSTAAECLAVIEVCEAEVKHNPAAAQWFDAITPWRPDNFSKKLAMDPKQCAPAQLAIGLVRPQPPPISEVLADIRAAEYCEPPPEAQALFDSVKGAQ